MFRRASFLTQQNQRIYIDIKITSQNRVTTQVTLFLYMIPYIAKALYVILSNNQPFCHKNKDGAKFV